MTGADRPVACYRGGGKGWLANAIAVQFAALLRPPSVVEYKVLCIMMPFVRRMIGGLNQRAAKT
jgi:hypothetical protein